MRAAAELDQQPLDAVRRPDADAIAALHTQREQPRRHVVRAPLQVVPGEALAGRRKDHCIAPAMAQHGAVEQRGDGHEFQRLVGLTAHVRQPAVRTTSVVAVAAQEVGGEGVGAHCFAGKEGVRE